MRQRLSLLATLAALAAISLAGCGGSSADPGTGTADGQSSVDGTQIKQVPAIPHVVIATTAGDITVKLNPEKSPLTVENFLHYVAEGFYNDTIFHEVRRGDVIIGGGYTRDLKEKPAGKQPVRNEARNGLKNVRGTIAMVREPNVIDSSTTQFFFNLGDNSDYLDPMPLEPGQQPEHSPEKYGYCVFGEVVGGESVLEEIAQSDLVTDNGGPLPFLPKRQVVITEVRREK
jgi:peptidyl-prolyl cis-trans isomerase A (cyclophilin A)